jgi:lysophospholipase L1-like esterase
MQTATELDIPIIDIHKEVFDPHPDPLSLFPLRRNGGHYNAEGYKLVAEAIGKRLEVDSYVPIKSKK